VVGERKARTVQVKVATRKQGTDLIEVGGGNTWVLGGARLNLRRECTSGGENEKILRRKGDYEGLKGENLGKKVVRMSVCAEKKRRSYCQIRNQNLQQSKGRRAKLH